KAWADFAMAAHKAGARHTRPGVAVLRDLSANYPLAQDIEILAGLHAETPAPQSWISAIEKAQANWLAAQPYNDHYYIALDGNIIDGTWPKRSGCAPG
ncbi:MAG: hypothetical protein KJ667_03010, partial [Alphaproteobacteria bacterium]|nr:hypothetical protein [Alphaproteobacteria bacterium]